MASRRILFSRRKSGVRPLRETFASLSEDILASLFIGLCDYMHGSWLARHMRKRMIPSDYRQPIYATDNYCCGHKWLEIWPNINDIRERDRVPPMGLQGAIAVFNHLNTVISIGPYVTIIRRDWGKITALDKMWRAVLKDITQLNSNILELATESSRTGDYRILHDALEDQNLPYRKYLKKSKGNYAWAIGRILAHIPERLITLKEVPYLDAST